MKKSLLNIQKNTELSALFVKITAFKATIFGIQDQIVAIGTCIIETERDVGGLLGMTSNQMADAADKKANHCT
jgi:hypothetical protein